MHDIWNIFFSFRRRNLGKKHAGWHSILFATADTSKGGHNWSGGRVPWRGCGRHCGPTAGHSQGTVFKVLEEEPQFQFARVFLNLQNFRSACSRFPACTGVWWAVSWAPWRTRACSGACTLGRCPVWRPVSESWDRSSCSTANVRQLSGASLGSPRARL